MGTSGAARMGSDGNAAYWRVNSLLATDRDMLLGFPSQVEHIQANDYYQWVAKKCLC